MIQRIIRWSIVVGITQYLIFAFVKWDIAFITKLGSMTSDERSQILIGFFVTQVMALIAALRDKIKNELL